MTTFSEEPVSTLNDSADQLRLEAFKDLFPEATHEWLLLHAAFPMALTTDLLYKIWVNFKPTLDDATIFGETPFGILTKQIVDGYEKNQLNQDIIPINAVGDLLLSPLCREIGHNLYEFYPYLREVLWKTLPPQRRRQLADFLLKYLTFCPEKIPSPAFAESQRLWAEITLGQFDRVNNYLAEIYTKNPLQNATSKRDFILNLIAQKTDTVAAPATNESVSGNPSLSDVEKLTQGINAYNQGSQEVAHKYLESIRQNLSSEKTTKGFNVPIPKALWESLPVLNPETEQPKGKIYAVLVGIDKYKSDLIMQLNGCVNDVQDWQNLLKSNYPEASLVSLSDAQATKTAIEHALLEVLRHLQSEDTLLFMFSGHSHNEDSQYAWVTHDSISQQIETYLSAAVFKSLITSSDSKNPFIVIISDNGSGSDDWIDIYNEKHVLLSATITGQESYAKNNRSIFTTSLIHTLTGHPPPSISYRKLIREAIIQLREESFLQTPQLFGHSKAVNQVFLKGEKSQITYLNELLKDCDFKDIEDIKNFGGNNQEQLIATLEKYTLLKGAKQLKMVRISSEMSVRQIPIFQKEYLKSLPYEIKIQDISLFHAPSRTGLKDSMSYQEEIENDLSALQDAHIIVFVLNRALVNDFKRHSTIAPVVNHLRRFEYKVVCSILWEDCDRGDTALRDYPVFSLRQPLSRASFQKYNFAAEIEREIEEYYQDWQPVINKWVTDLAESGFENELKERIEKAKQTQKLDLSGMGFEKLPKAVWELEDLKIIDLYNNKLAELPESLTQFQSLEKLYASKNPITSLPLFLNELPNLRVLKIDDAQITEFPAWLCKHPALEDISLENNQVEIIPSALKDLPKLRLIDFRGNPVVNLSIGLLKCTKGKLTEYINNIKTQNLQSLRPYPDLTFLYLSKNDWSSNNSSDWTTNGLLLIEKIFEKSEPKYLISSGYLESDSQIFFFPHSQLRTLIVHISESVFTDEDVTRASKLFLEYPTGTIFFLNFSNSKRLAELLYKQKHVPIIAFDGELDEKEAIEAIRLFYGHYQESKNAMAAFDQMTLRLVDFQSSSKGLYILYRY